MSEVQEKCFLLTRKALPAADQFNNKVFLRKGLLINHHITGSYPHKDELEHNLRVLQNYIEDPASKNDIVECIIEKLQEGANSCSAGFHDRVNSILLILIRPVTIEGFLESFRIALVNSVAHQCTGEVHKHNTFFNHANDLKFGVAPLNSSDANSQPRLSNQAHIEALTRAMKERYTAWSILNDLLLNIESELRAFYDYDELKEEGCNDYKIYDRFLTFFKTLLADKNLSYQDIFLMDIIANDCEIYKIMDINWHSIQKKLWEKLISEDYLRFDPAEERFYNKLLSKDEQSFQEDSELIQSLRLYLYPSLLKHVIKPHRQKVSSLIFASIESTGNDELFFKALSCFNEFEEDLEKRTAFVHTKIKAWLSIADNKTRLINNSDAQLFLKLIQYIPLSDIPESILRQILSDENAYSIVKAAGQSYPKSLKALLEKITQLHGLEFTKKIFTTNDEYNNKLLTSAAQSYPLALEPLVNYLINLEDRVFIKQTLTDKNKARRNFMMLAALCRPQVFEPLLMTIASWDEAIQGQILFEHDINGHNVLMLTLINRPQAFGVLLELVVKLEFEIQKQILSSKDYQGRNILMLAAENDLQAFEALLKIIVQWDDIKKEILTAKDNNGSNVLMLLLINFPQAFKALLDLIANLDSETQKQILTDKNKDKVNYLMLLAEIHPQSLEFILKNYFYCFAAQDSATKKQILSGGHPFESISFDTKECLKKEINTQWDNSNSNLFKEIKKLFKLNEPLEKMIIMDEVNKHSLADLAAFQREISKSGSLLNRLLYLKEQKSLGYRFFNIPDSSSTTSCKINKTKGCY